MTDNVILGRDMRPRAIECVTCGPSLFRAGDRVIAEVCTKWFLCGATYEVARDQEPGGQVFLKAGPILELPVDPSSVRERAMNKTTVFGRYAGQLITATDALGVTGPATIRSVEDTGTYHVEMGFAYQTQDGSSHPANDGFTWTFFSHETSDYGLTLTFEPFQPAPYDADGLHMILAWNGQPIRDLDREGLLGVIEELWPRVFPGVTRLEQRSVGV